LSKSEQYVVSLREIDVRLDKGGDLIGDLGNTAAVLKKRLGFFWVGFYFVNTDRLVLGPFQGAPACVFLPYGEGVCGTCASEKQTILVPDVRAFSGHIACDPDSRSEIAVPVFDREDRLRAVLDVDSNRPDAFDETDRVYLEKLAHTIGSHWK